MPSAAHQIIGLSSAVELWKSFLPNLKQASLVEVQRKVDVFRRVAESENVASLDFGASQLLHWKEVGISRINVGGPMAGGKSTIAESLQSELGADWKLVDADDFHPPANIEKQRRGEALTNEDRIPFLTAVKGFLGEPKRITTCSALTDGYRAFLAGQETESITNYQGPAAWKIQNQNLGLLQVIVLKPYEVALEQLDAANTGRSAPRLFHGEPHFIKVTKASEAASKAEGKLGILENQYKLLGSADSIFPWEAIVIEPQKFKTDTGYNTKAMMSTLVNLPFIG